MAQIKMQANGVQDANLRAAVEGLREEVRALRDTTMQYDLSFDTALQNIEHRMAGVERRVQSVETQPQTLQVGIGNGQ